MERTATKITITGRCLGQSDGNGWEFQEPPNVLINDRGIRNLASLLEKFEGQRVRVVITPTKGAGATREGMPRRDKARGWLLVGDQTLDGADLLQAFVGMPVEISAELLDVAIVKTEAPVVTGKLLDPPVGEVKGPAASAAPKRDVVAVQVKGEAGKAGA